MGVDNRLASPGHVSYLEIPTVDVERSAAFYEAVFGWSVERREDGRASFDDRSGTLIGRWVAGRAPSCDPGFLPYIYVDRIDEVVDHLVKQGGAVVEAGVSGRRPVGRHVSRPGGERPGDLAGGAAIQESGP